MYSNKSLTKGNIQTCRSVLQSSELVSLATLSRFSHIKPFLYSAEERCYQTCQFTLNLLVHSAIHEEDSGWYTVLSPIFRFSFKGDFWRIQELSSLIRYLWPALQKDSLICKFGFLKWRAPPFEHAFACKVPRLSPVLKLEMQNGKELVLHT